MNKQAIGVFDSGVGGLSVLKTLQRLLPHEHFIYLADSAYAPYGLQPTHLLVERGQRIAQFFVKHQVKAIVIACNTATSVMAEQFREQLSVPIVALEPAIKPACERSQTGNVGVLATQNTLNSARYRRLIEQYAQRCRIYQSACIGFVEQVERGDLTSEKTAFLIRDTLAPMLANHVDILVLGCTHYPFLTPMIRRVSEQLGVQDLRILDTAEAVAKQLQAVLHHGGLLAPVNAIEIRQQPHRYFTSADTTLLTSVFAQLMAEPIDLQPMNNP